MCQTPHFIPQRTTKTILIFVVLATILFAVLLPNTQATPAGPDTMTLKYENGQPAAFPLGQDNGQIAPTNSQPQEPSTTSAHTPPHSKIGYRKAIHVPLQDSEGTEPPETDGDVVLDQIEILSTY